MTDPIEVAIQAALCTWLQAPDLTSPATPIAMPFVPFSPVVGVSYIQVQPLLRAQPSQPWLSFAGPTINTGIFQVDAVIPDEKGEAPGYRLAGLVATRFARGTQWNAGGFKLQVVAVPQTASALKDAAWVRFPVSIPYLIITT